MTEQTAGVRDTDRKAAKKKLAEMNLLDDFLFTSVVAYPEIGEQFVKVLLKAVFGREFRHLSVTAQKVYYGADTDLHGARLDVYLEPEVEEGSGEAASVYDIEPDQSESAAVREVLPRRVRFYHGKIATKNLGSGMDYDKLKDVTIIMILPYDPFGLGRMIYTIKTRCLEVPDMPYEDGADTLFLYTKGTEGVPNEMLRQLLHYMEDTTYENAVNRELRRLHEMVETVKRDPEVTGRYMFAYLREMERIDRAVKKAVDEAVTEAVAEARTEALAEGRAKGMAEGMAEGKAKGKAEGIAEGIAEGELYAKISLVCKKLIKNKTLEETAEDLEEKISVIEPLYDAAKKFAPDYDPNLVYEWINRQKEQENLKG